MHYVILHAVPFAPVNIMATYRTLRIHSIATVTFSSSKIPSEIFDPEYYELSVTPQLIAQPVTNTAPFVFNVTIPHYAKFNVTIASVSCGGRNSSSLTIISG